MRSPPHISSAAPGISCPVVLPRRWHPVAVQRSQSRALAALASLARWRSAPPWTLIFPGKDPAPIGEDGERAGLLKMGHVQAACRDDQQSVTASREQSTRRGLHPRPITPQAKCAITDLHKLVRHRDRFIRLVQANMCLAGTRYSSSPKVWSARPMRSHHPWPHRRVGLCENP